MIQRGKQHAHISTFQLCSIVVVIFHFWVETSRFSRFDTLHKSITTESLDSFILTLYIYRNRRRKKNAHKVNTLYNTPSSINGRIKRLSSFIFVIIKSKYSVVQCIIHGKRQYQPHTIHFGANALNGQLTHEESCKIGCALLVNRQ